MRKILFLMNQAGDDKGGDWRSTLPEAIRNDASLSGFKDVGSLASSFIETKKMVGSSVRPPGPDATPEARAEFVDRMQKSVGADFLYMPADAAKRTAVEGEIWKALGLPGKPEEYAVPAELAAKVNADEARAIAARTKLTKGQFGELTKAMSEAAIAAETKFKDEHAALDKEWGAAKTEKTQAAAAVAEKLGNAALAKAISEGRAPAVDVRFMAAVAQAVGANPKELGRQTDSGNNKLTPDEAKLQIREMMMNRSHAYWNAADPGHAAAVKRMVELQGFADPSATRTMEVAGVRS